MQHRIQKFEDGCGDRLDYNCSGVSEPRYFFLIRLVPACLPACMCDLRFVGDPSDPSLIKRLCILVTCKSKGPHPFFIVFAWVFLFCEFPKHTKKPPSPPSNDQGESTASCRWTGWVWGITTGWSSRLQGKSPIVLQESMEYISHYTEEKPKDRNRSPPVGLGNTRILNRLCSKTSRCESYP